jgi:GrpB-like predicted nucleotidyltransferase (UPF0157 family)
MPEPVTEAQLRALLVNGLKPTRVTLCEYDPVWPARYEAASARLRAVLGDRIRLVEHVGSTSVPGLIAKPVVDIVIGVEDPDDEAGYIPDLEAAGYRLAVHELGHRALRGEESGQPINLHCYRPDSIHLRRYLVFRDRLRAEPADRELYAATKLSLTDREWPDMNVYAEAKGPVISQILTRAGWADQLP